MKIQEIEKKTKTKKKQTNGKKVWEKPPEIIFGKGKQKQQ